MRIYRGHKNARISEVYQKTSQAARRRTPAQKTKLPKDEIVLSPRTAEVRKLTELAKLLPDVRQEKVRNIKRKLEDGTYDVSAKSVAGSIVKLHEELHHGNE